jgi:hypothetical protein
LAERKYILSMPNRIISVMSLEGSAGRMCVDAAAEERYAYRRRDARRYKVQRPQPRDAVRVGVCWHCGLPGPHPSLFDCIDALRERLARLEH